MAGKSFHMAPITEGHNDSLEWEQYAKDVSDLLVGYGMVPAPNLEEADLIAFFDFTINEGEAITSAYTRPNFGVTGYSGATTFGNTMRLNPTYGVTGYSTHHRTDIVYTRQARLLIAERRQEELLFESNVISRGGCPNFGVVAPYILPALTHTFPEGGSTVIRQEVEALSC